MENKYHYKIQGLKPVSSKPIAILEKSQFSYDTPDRACEYGEKDVNTNFQAFGRELEVELGAAEDFAIIDARGGENPLEVFNSNSKIQAIFIISLIRGSRNFTGRYLRNAA